MTDKLMPLSYSRLSTFETCPRKFEYLYVLKSVKDEGSTATDYGTRVHEALENYGRALVSGDPVAMEGVIALEGGEAGVAAHGQEDLQPPRAGAVRASDGDQA